MWEELAFHGQEIEIISEEAPWPDTWVSLHKAAIKCVESDFFSADDLERRADHSYEDLTTLERWVWRRLDYYVQIAYTAYSDKVWRYNLRRQRSRV